LDFMQFTYGIFGMGFELHLSTRPAKAVGAETASGLARWNNAETALAECLDEFVGVGNWKVNPGDGAFYGPKIDIKVFDALKRQHQCATIQLDFQLPRRFNLSFRNNLSAATSQVEDSAQTSVVETEGKPDDDDDNDLDATFSRPVMIHRAILGSVERMIAVLIEHFGGFWPLWLSPRQALVVPVSGDQRDYAQQVCDEIQAAGFFVDVENSNKTLNKKIREGQLAKYNFILVVVGKSKKLET